MTELSGTGRESPARMGRQRRCPMADTVLVVEDDPDIVELLELYLGGSGFEVVSASDGAEALRMLEARPADVALVDIMMPHMNGYDFIKALRERSDMPVIIVSARTSPADKIVGLDTGADGFVAKPFDPLEVVAYVRAALRRWGAPGRPEAGAEEAASPWGTCPLTPSGSPSVARASPSPSRRRS